MTLVWACDSIAQNLDTMSHPTGSIQLNNQREGDANFEKDNSLYQESFYPYDQSISVRLGFAFDIKELNARNPEDKEYSFLVGLRYQLPSITKNTFEIGFDFLTQPKLYLTGVYKIIFYRTEAFRPFLSLGTSLRFDEGDKFETPLTYKSYNLYFSTGFEDQIAQARSIRLDFDIHYGDDDFLFLISGGYTWGF
jgi:hypothetical protein